MSIFILGILFQWVVGVWISFVQRNFFIGMHSPMHILNHFNPIRYLIFLFCRMVMQMQMGWRQPY